MPKLRLVLPLFLMAGASAFAQTATILGTVTDPTGSSCPRPRHHHQCRRPDVKRVVQTNSAGKLHRAGTAHWNLFGESRGRRFQSL